MMMPVNPGRRPEELPFNEPIGAPPPESGPNDNPSPSEVPGESGDPKPSVSPPERPGKLQKRTRSLKLGCVFRP